MKYITKRNIIGSFVFMIMAGEPTVGGLTGLFSIRGFIVLFLLYFAFFNLIESIISKYDINALGTVLLSFALYSVLVTGLLHGEILDYITHSKNDLFITLIRIQASFYPLFAYWVLGKIAPRVKNEVLSIKAALVIFVIYALIITPTHLFGFWNMARTFKGAPMVSLVFTLAALFSVLISLRLRSSKPKTTQFKYLTAWSVFFFVVAIIPLLKAFVILLLFMISVSVYYLSKKSFRSMSVST